MKLLFLVLSATCVPVAQAQQATELTEKYRAEIQYAKNLFSQIDQGDIFPSLHDDQKRDYRNQNILIKHHRKTCQGPIPERVIYLASERPGTSSQDLYLTFRSRVQDWKYRCQESLQLERLSDGRLKFISYQTQPVE